MADVWDWPGRLGHPHRRQPRQGAARQARRRPDPHRPRRRLRPRDRRPRMTAQPLARVTSLKVKLGLLVAASVTVAALVASLGRGRRRTGVAQHPGHDPARARRSPSSSPSGMTSPLRQMTAAAGRMATRRLRRAGHRHLERRGRRPRPGLQHDGRATSPPSTASAASWSPTSPTSCVRRWPRCAPCSRTSSTASRRATRRRWRRALDQAERPSDLVDDLLDLSRVDAGSRAAQPGAGAARAAARRRRRRGSRAPAAPCRVRRAGRPRGPRRQRRPRPAAPAASPTCSTTRRGTARPAARSRSPRRGTATGTSSRCTTRARASPPADRERVFEPFGTLARTDGGGGTGLGLAIARWVTDLHGGSIRFVDPEPGRAEPACASPCPSTTRPTDPSRRTPMPAARAHRPPHRSPAPPPRSPYRAAAARRLFGEFWPERGRPGAGSRCCSARLGVGAARRARAAVPRPRARHVPGAARRGRRSCWPRAPARRVHPGLRGAVRAARRDRRAPATPRWIVLLCLMAGAALCMAAVTGARTLLGFVLAGLAWPLAGLRGLPVARPHPARARRGWGTAPRSCAPSSGRCSASSCSALLFASADALLAEWWSRCCPTCRSARRRCGRS